MLLQDLDGVVGRQATGWDSSPTRFRSSQCKTRRTDQASASMRTFAKAAAAAAALGAAVVASTPMLLRVRGRE